MKKIKRLAALFIVLALLAPSVLVWASAHPDRVVDEADLLTDSEETELAEKLDTTSERYECDVVVVTIRSIGNMSAQAYADDYYDYNGYGMGEKASGILLLLASTERKWAISTYKDGAYAFNDAGLTYLEDQIIPYFREDDYAGGFQEFANLAEQFLKEAEKGTPYSDSNRPRRKLALEWILLSAVIAVALAFLVTMLMKSQLKSVRFKDQAADYIKKGSFHLNRNEDIFLYSRVTRVPKPKDNDKGGHSTMHTSSSGRYHGGRSGSF